jgi:hypothetical protein
LPITELDSRCDEPTVEIQKRIHTSGSENL